MGDADMYKRARRANSTKLTHYPKRFSEMLQHVIRFDQFKVIILERIWNLIQVMCNIWG